MATNWLGDAIKRQREKLGITQAELAQRLGVHKQTIVKYEAGAISPPAGKLSDISHALELTIAEFLHLEGDLEAAGVPPTDEELADELEDIDTMVRRVPRLARNLPLAIREYLAELRLRLTKGGASDEEIEEAMDLLRSPQLFTFYKGGAPSEYNEEDVLRGIKGIAEGVIIPELRERGRKVQ